MVTRLLPEIQLRALGYLRLGRTAMWEGPLAAPSRGRSSTSEFSKAEKVAYYKERGHAAKVASTTCAVCKGANEDPFHVLTECSNARVTSARAGAIATLVGNDGKLALNALLQLTALRTDGQLTHEDNELIRTVVSAAASTDWASSDGRFVLFHFLCVRPWSASVVPSQSNSFPLTAAMGAIFDRCNAKRHRQRTMANSWVGFAGKSVVAIFSAWNAAFAMAGAAAGTNARVANPASAGASVE